MPALSDVVGAFTPPNFQAMLRAMMDNNVVIFPTSAAPTNGTSGTYNGLAGPGSILYGTGTVAGILWFNVGTLASPTWNYLDWGVGAGAGGAVTQATSKATGVTLNKVSGTITMNNASLATATTVVFTVTDSLVAAADAPVVAIKSGAATAGSYQATVDAVAAGSFNIAVRNVTGGSLSEALVLNFVVIKGAAS